MWRRRRWRCRIRIKVNDVVHTQAGESKFQIKLYSFHLHLLYMRLCEDEKMICPHRCLSAIWKKKCVEVVAGKNYHMNHKLSIAHISITNHSLTIVMAKQKLNFPNLCVKFVRPVSTNKNRSARDESLNFTRIFTLIEWKWQTPDFPAIRLNTYITFIDKCFAHRKWNWCERKNGKFSQIFFCVFQHHFHIYVINLRRN